MNFKNPETDSGKYVNGVYTSKNGFTGSGLNCPKGTRLYNTDVISPIFFMPEDRGPNEDFEMITPEVCEGILPYYAISNYGRIMNVNSGKIMKPNYRPNGYEYYCLAADGCKNGQRKYNTNRIVMKTFDPRENADELQVNHINGNKSENYYQKLMEDGTIQSNLEWSTPSENIVHSRQSGLNIGPVLDMEKAKHIRALRDEGYSYTRISTDFYPYVSGTTIQSICKNITYHDPNYTPKNYMGSYTDNSKNGLKLSDKDAEIIRGLFKNGYNYADIQQKFYPQVSIGTIGNIVLRKSHNREV